MKFCHAKVLIRMEISLLLILESQFKSISGFMRQTNMIFNGYDRDQRYIASLINESDEKGPSPFKVANYCLFS